MIGKTLGHYRVGEQLGRGGMGEVYVADDLNLNRKVALKFLPDTFADDPERMARFEREAKLLASLNHPNIASIYGLEQAEGKRFLVLELVEGETLAQRISKGAQPVDEALAICRQIAEGLEAAHEKGVIHRDLKPANVMITEGDKVKILDFGLAKALSDETQSVDSSQSPTLTEAMTRPGVILGTAAYMSPEQAKGKSVDKRADIWAFGCILYECLTGKKAFEEETVTETLASVLKNEPDWQILPATTPSNIRLVLRRCLGKNMSGRFHCVGDLRIEIEEVRDMGGETTPAMKQSWLALIWAAIASLLVIALAFPALQYFRGSKAPEAMIFQISAPPMQDYSMAISPDGRAIAFVASSAGSSALFVREIGSATAKQINGTEGARFPFWSPDSRTIAFGTDDRLKRVDLSGGLPRDICAAREMAGGAWNSNGVIVFSEYPVLRRVSATGGDPITVAQPDESQKGRALTFPYFLPDGVHFLYTVWSGTASKEGIYVGSVDSSERTQLQAGMSMATYANPGYLLFQQGGALFARPFDAKNRTFTGEAVGIADGLVSNVRTGLAIFGASQNNTLIYRAGGMQAKSQFAWFDRAGKQLQPAGDPGVYRPIFELSPDGKRIAVVRSDPATLNLDIWLVEWERNVATQLTFDHRITGDIAWSPDGLRIGFGSGRRGTSHIYEMKSSGAGEQTPMVNTSGPEFIEDWSKDGRYIAYGMGTGEADLYALPLFGDRKPFPIAQSPSKQDEPHFSPDGKWFAYDSNESGTWQIYVNSFPAADQRVQVSTNGGAQPRWRGDGKELYYIALDGRMMAVDIRANTKIEPDKPHALFDTGLYVVPDNDQYAVTSDGLRFLLLKPLMETMVSPITVVLNWTALLK